MALRLRQVVLVAPALGPALEEVRDGLGLEPCFHDQSVAQFGLENVLFPVGDQFLEIIAPVEEGTTAGRQLDRRGGAGGYMVILQCDDLDRRRARLPDLGVRVVWQADLDDARATHLHPKDTGGTLLSLDTAEPWESWRWAGPAWRDHVRLDVVTGITAIELGATDPAGMAARWASVLEAPRPEPATIRLDDAAIRFVPAGSRGEGLDAVDLTSAERARAGGEQELSGIRFRFR